MLKPYTSASWGLGALKSCRRAFFVNLELLHEINAGAVLALAHVTTQFQGLLERQVVQRAIADRLCRPQQNDVAA